MQQVINSYREMTGDSQFLRLVWMREDAARREAAALANAEKKARIEIVKNLLALDIPMDKIISASGMSESEINALS